MARAADPEEMMPREDGPGGMVVERHGSGPPVLLVHGLGGPLMWKKLVLLLSATHEVIVPHLPGFGESPAPVRRMSSGDHAALLGGLIASMGPDRICLVGVSYGGEIAARLAARLPGRISRLVLVCPTGMWDSPPRESPGKLVRLVLAHRWLQAIAVHLLRLPSIADYSSRRSFHDITKRPAELVSGYLEQLSRPGHAEALWNALREITSERGGTARAVAGISLPVTIVLAQNDRVIPAPEIPPTELIGRGATRPHDLRILGECGHSAALEKPEELSGIIRDAPPGSLYSTWGGTRAEGA